MAFEAACAPQHDIKCQMTNVREHVERFTFGMLGPQALQSERNYKPTIPYRRVGNFQQSLIFVAKLSGKRKLET